MSETPSKAELRNLMRQSRAARDAGWVTATSRRIADRVAALPEFKRASVIGCFLSLPGEVDTRPILEAAWRAGKRVAMPARREDGEYMPAWYSPDEPMTREAFGLLQPLNPHWAKPDRFDLMLVPGVAFSRRGDRLGHGRGYYDRMLARLAGRLDCRVGICFANEVLPEIPVGETDVAMDAVVTEEALYRAS